MLTVEFREYGAVDRLLLTDAPMPEPRTGEVLIEVHACGVNRVDILSREGQTPTPVLLPHISGTEVAGRSAALGKGV
jgi:NADPH:quinone reductase